MTKDLQQKLSQLDSCIEIQKDSLERGYMHGMLNGMIFARSILAEAPPEYVSLPRRYPARIRIRHKSRRER